MKKVGIIIGAILLIWIIYNNFGRSKQGSTVDQSDIDTQQQKVNQKSQANAQLFIDRINKTAKENNAGVGFQIQPDNSSTLWIQRNSTMKPDEISSMALESYLMTSGTSESELKKNGFDLVRIYTNSSTGISDYKRIIL